MMLYSVDAVNASEFVLLLTSVTKGGLNTKGEAQPQ